MPPFTRSDVARIFLGGERGDEKAPLIEATWKERGRRALRFGQILLRKAGDDAITLKAAALAFVTLLSLVPLLAAFVNVGTRVLDAYRDRVLEALAGVLPYSEAKILDTIQGFVEQAANLQQVGTLVFILVSMGAFLTIEETINNIWQVGERRSLRAKLLSFTLLIFWGPLVLGGLLSFLVLVKQRPDLGVLFEEAILVQAVPLLVGSLALTMLYWQVPNTAVRFRAALAGGICAAVLLDLLRVAFGFYVQNLTELNVVVYGSFALAIFFMVSIQLAWFAVLLGCEVAYVTQNFAALTRARQLDARFRGPWIGLGAVLELVRGLRSGSPIQSAERLSSRLGVTTDAVREALQPLEETAIVRRGVDDEEEEGFLLGRDPHQLTLRETLQSYDRPVENLLESMEDPSQKAISSLERELRSLRDERLADRTLVDLIDSVDS